MIEFNRPYVSGNEIGYLRKVIDERSFAGNGVFTKGSQALLEALTGAPSALLTHSCTGALELAAMRLGLGPGDEVIVPSFTFVATASAFLRTGASVVFCDVDPRTMNLDPDDAAGRITRRTKAIVPVHYGGIGARMDEVLALASEHGLAVVEDAAQGLGASIDERPLGTFAPMATLSFHETKNIHSGLGGALLVNDEALFERAEYMWERGTDRAKMRRGMADKYTWVEPGSSFYPSELQAAFLLAQLESLDENLSQREAIWRRYDEALRPLSGVSAFRLPEIPSDRRLNWHSFFLICDTPEVADDLRESLAARGIGAHSHYVPLHSSPMGRRLGYQPEDVPLTESLAPCVLRLPLHNDLTTSDVERVCDSVIDLVTY